MMWRMTVPDRPDLFVDVDRLGSPSLPHRMAVESGDNYPAPWLACACGWETAPLTVVLYLDDLVLISLEHYRTADQPGLIPAATTTH